MNSQLPQVPFTLQQALDHGVSRHELRAEVREGRVRKLFTNVYVPAGLPDTIEARAAALRLVISPHQVVCDRTAAWLHGVDVFGLTDKEVLPPVELCALRGHAVAARSGVDGRTRDLHSGDVMEVDGLLVTTPLRTALDLACGLGRYRGLGALDQFMRHHGVTTWELRRELRRYFRRRGVVQARELIPLADPRAESLRESWVRLVLHEAGLPAAVPQFRVFYDATHHYRLDLAYPAHRVVVEYDGEEFHDSEEQRTYDEKRRAWLRDQGWTVIVVRKADLEDPRQAWVEEVREALLPRTRRLRWARPA